MDAQRLRQFAADPAEFRRHLRIDTGAGVRRLGDVMDDWQDRDFRAMDAAWRRVAGQDVAVRHSRAWWERPRGSSKSQDVAVMSLWAMAFSQRRLNGVVVAVDADQAALIRRAIEGLLSLNPWLAEVIQAKLWKVINNRTGSELTILPSDAASSWGLLPDFVIADEVSMWPHDKMWVSILSAAAKRPHCLLLAAMNSGFTESWAYETREKIRQDDRWYFSHLDGSCASWIDEQTLAEQRRLLPAAAYARLWMNEWTRGAGDALADVDIEAAVTLDGPMIGAEPGWFYGLGVDAAVRKDNAAVVALAGNPETRRVALAEVRVWRPGPGGRIDLGSLEAGIEDMAARFCTKHVAFDPYQMEAMAQRLEAGGLHMVPVPFSGKTKPVMATALLEAFRSRVIDLYPHRQLIEDLHRLVLVERSYGFSLEVSRGTGVGHGDTAVALSIILPAAMATASEPVVEDYETIAGTVSA